MYSKPFPLFHKENYLSTPFLFLYHERNLLQDIFFSQESFLLAFIYDTLMGVAGGGLSVYYTENEIWKQSSNSYEDSLGSNWTNTFEKGINSSLLNYEQNS